MKKPLSLTDKSSFIFQIEVLVEGTTNGEALEQLLRQLNNSDFLDYQIQSGVQLGQLLDERRAASQTQLSIPTELPALEKSNISPPSATPSNFESVDNGLERIKQIIKKNTLIRLVVNKGLGITLNIPCRIINMNESENLITVYHVDEKQVYTFRLNEIEDYKE